MAVKTSWAAGDVLTAADLTDTFAAKAAASSVKILQVVYASSGSETTVASTTYTDINLSATITPTSSSNKVLVQAAVQFQADRFSDSSGHALRLLRGSTAVFSPDDAGSAYHGSGSLYIPGGGQSRTLMRGRAPFFYLDSPATTSATTYKLQGRSTDTTSTGSVVYQTAGQSSMLILMEVQA